MPMLRSLFLMLAVSLALTAPARAIPTDFSFQDVELRDIFQTVATLGRFNVLVDPQVARAKMCVNLKQVEPLDALFALAKIQELRVKRIRWEEGSTTVTYAIGRHEKIQKGFEPANARTIQLRFARAADVAALIEAKLPKDVDLSANHDARTNKLILHGGEHVLARIETLVRDVDLPLPAVNAKLAVLAGPADKLAPVWSGTSLLVQGVPARVQLGTTGGKPSAVPRLVRLAGHLSQRVNSDNFCSVTVALDVVLDRNGAETQVHFESEAQVLDGEKAVIGTMEVGPGEIVQLELTPEIVKCKLAGPQQQDPLKDVDPLAAPEPPKDGLDLDL